MAICKLFSYISMYLVCIHREPLHVNVIIGEGLSMSKPQLKFHLFIYLQNWVWSLSVTGFISQKQPIKQLTVWNPWLYSNRSMASDLAVESVVSNRQSRHEKYRAHNQSIFWLRFYSLNLSVCMPHMDKHCSYIYSKISVSGSFFYKIATHDTSMSRKMNTSLL